VGGSHVKTSRQDTRGKTYQPVTLALRPNWFWTLALPRNRVPCVSYFFEIMPCPYLVRRV
jgi:hypothetical protein